MQFSRTRALQEYSLPPSDLSPKSYRAFLPTPTNPWSLNGKVLEQCFESCPVVALSLTTAVEPFEQDTYGTGEELLQAGRVAWYAIVVMEGAVSGQAKRVEAAAYSRPRLLSTIFLWTQIIGERCPWTGFLSLRIAP